MLLVRDLIAQLEEEYPNKATELKDKSPEEVREYLAKLELIEHIKLIEEKGLDNGKD